MPRVDTEEFYQGSLDTYGTTAQGVQWISAETQEARFQVFLEALPEDLSQTTLVDAGCGFGDLYLYLLRHERVPGEYLGLDCMAPMVQRARARTGCEIRQCDILHEELPAADYYVCSGAMNTLTWDETRAFIRRCYEAARSAFLFNLLKGRDTSLIYNCRRPHEIQALAEELGAHMQVIEGYLHTDFTVFLRHP